MLAYTVKGFMYPISEMTQEDRAEYCKRVDRQLKDESDAAKRASRKGR